MAAMNVFKLDALPSTPEPNTIYLLKSGNPAFPNKFLPIITDNAGVCHEALSSSDYRRQHFNVKIENDNGVIKHSIFSTIDSTQSCNFATCISGHSPTPTITPTGNDISTNFSAGVKISSEDESVLVFNTKDINHETDSFTAFYTDLDAGVLTSINIILNVVSRNINGVTKKYLAIKFSNILSHLMPTTGDFIIVTMIGSCNPY